MRNNIASFEKTSRSRVKIMEKNQWRIYFCIKFCPKYNLTSASFFSSKYHIDSTFSQAFSKDVIFYIFAFSLLGHTYKEVLKESINILF